MILSRTVFKPRIIIYYIMTKYGWTEEHMVILIRTELGGNKGKSKYEQVPSFIPIKQPSRCRPNLVFNRKGRK